MDAMNDAAASMRVLGILTGITHVSGADYLRAINERVQARVPAARTEAMAKNCRCVLACVDCDTFVARLEAGDPDACARYLVDDGVGRLVAAGAEVLVIASNTGHVCCELVARVYPRLPVLHIADAVGLWFACPEVEVSRAHILWPRTMQPCGREQFCSSQMQPLPVRCDAIGGGARRTWAAADCTQLGARAAGAAAARQNFPMHP